MAALYVVFFAGLVVAIVVGHQKQKRQLAVLLETLAGRLEGATHDEKTRFIAGTLAGATVWLRHTTRGSGKQTTYWTEVDVEIPPQYPLRMFVRKHGWLDQGKIDRGEMVDVLVGDPAFDERFVVEAAPADVARILLDPRERSYLHALSDRLWIEVTMERPSSDRAVLRLAMRSWVYDANDAMRALEAMAAIGGRLRDAYAAVERAAQPTDVGSPYRPMLDDEAGREAADARLQEVAHVDQVRTARQAREQMLAVALILVFVFVVLVAAVAGS